MGRSRYGYLLGQFVILAGCLAFPALAMAQTLAGIAGTVRDTSGAVLPGVTVEAASPALIEKVRTAVTDESGQFRILELRPGAYTVTFTLVGFSTIRREGLELTTGSTATVNVELPLGSLEETITVTGAAPIVDVQNTAATSVLTTAVLDSLPVARGLQGFGALTLGAVSLAQSPTRDVGGNSGDWAGRMFIHGVNEYGWYGTEGLTTMSILTDGSRRQEINYGGLQEAVVNTGLPTAEFRSGGVSVNLIPKEGGNTFRGVLFGDYTGESLQSDNLDDELNARGVSTTNATKIVSDVYGGFGGPVVQDKLWFYTSHRWKKAEQELAGVYYNKLQGQSPLPHVSTTLFYEPDLSRPAYIPRPTRQYYHERLTWQAAAKHKITLLASDEDNCLCGSGLGPAGDPASAIYLRTAQRIIQPGWTYTATNRFLLEAGFNRRWEVTNTWFDQEKVGRNALGDFPGGNVQYTDRAMQDIGLGIRYGSHAGGSNPPLSGSGWHVDYAKSPSRTWAGRVAMSYVSGSHAFKTGVTHNGGWMDFGPGYPNFPEMYQLRNRVPSRPCGADFSSAQACNRRAALSVAAATPGVIISPTMWFHKKPAALGDFEQLVLLGVLRLADEAYGAAIRQEIHARSRRDVSINAVYTTLDRLERKGLLRSWEGDPTPQRGGRRRRFYALRPAGVTALRQAYHAFRSMTEGLETRLETK